MNSFVFTNISIYKSISDEAYLNMKELIESGRSPKPDGSEGSVITYDSEHKSFKQAMISIVFTGMWLEVLMHLLIVKKYDEKKFKKYDFKSYKEKLSLIGCPDQDILDRAQRFQKCRKELVHEKAHFDTGEIKNAQEEALNTHELLVGISEYFSNEIG
jgi:hypothetical protein